MTRELISEGGSLWMLAFPAEELGVVAIEDTEGSPNRVAPTRVRAAMEQFEDLYAVVDGSQFGLADGAGGYAAAKHDVVYYRHLDRSAGIDIPSSGRNSHTGQLHADEGASISVVNGVAQFFKKNVFADGADVGIQSYPNVVYGGRNVAGFRLNEVVYMSAVGALSDGRCFLALGHYDIPEFADALVGKGAVYAGYGDGGGSGGRAIRLPSGGVDFAGSREERRVATLYACVSKDTTPDGRGGVASGSAKFGGAGSPARVLAAAAIATVAGALGAVAWSERRAIARALGV